MGGPPDDPQLQSLWTELARSGYDPDEFLESARRNGVSGGLHLPQMSDLFDAVCSGFEEWEHVWAWAGPTEMPHDHHYEFAHFIVEWDETEERWLPETGASPMFEARDARMSDDLFTVAAADARDAEQSPLARTVTGLPREEVPPLVESLISHAEESPVELRCRLCPDTVGEVYEFSYEFIEWQGDEFEGEWTQVSTE